MKNRKMVVIIVALIGLIAGVLWLKGFMNVDSCLDSGGSWNNEMKRCEH